MNIFNKKVASLLFVFSVAKILSGCSYPCYSTQGCRDLLLSTIRTEDFGKKPNKKEVEKTAHDLVKAALKDPDSVKFKEMSDFVRCYRAGDYGYIFEYGWCFYIPYNAKNSYGGYTGYEDAIFITKNNFVKWAESAKSSFGYGALNFRNFDEDKESWLEKEENMKK